MSYLKIKKIIFILILILLYNFIAYSYTHSTIIKNKYYKIELTHFKLKIKNLFNSNTIEIKSNYEEPFLSAGFLKDKYYYIKEKLIVGKYVISIFINNIKEFELSFMYPVYSPSITENKGSLFFIFLKDDFSLNVYNLNSNKLIHKLYFDVPIYGLKKLNESFFSLMVFINGKYKKLNLKIDDILLLKKISFKKIKYSKSKIKNYNAFIKIKDEPKEIDYTKIVGLGDSITYGYINRQPAPELGYIPRLQELVDSWVDGFEIVNEGIPGATTIMIIENLNDIMLRNLAKVFLIHIGTNDIVFRNIPVETTLFNIRYIVEKLKEKNTIPVVSTLIPRSGWFGEGIFKQRGIQITEGIRKLAEEKKLYIVDFWELFLNYPEDEGGYDSLMSDNTHPSEQGYQLMAEEWFKVLKKIPPDQPEIDLKETIFDYINRETGIRISLFPQKELDFKNFRVYVIEGSEKTLLKELNSNETDIFLPSGKTYKLVFTAIDIDGNESKNSEETSYTPYRIY